VIDLSVGAPRFCYLLSAYLVLLMQLTHFLAQLLGLYCIIVAVVMLTRKEAMLGIVTSLIQNRSLLFLVEILGLITGLALVLGHNVWSKGPLALIVTLVGWVALIRSTVLLFLSPEAIGEFLKTIRYQQNYYLFTASALILGLYLTFAGFAG
jgi:hypothetical protein